MIKFRHFICDSIIRQKNNYTCKVHSGNELVSSQSVSLSWYTVKFQLPFKTFHSITCIIVHKFPTNLFLFPRGGNKQRCFYRETACSLGVEMAWLCNVGGPQNIVPQTLGLHTSLPPILSGLLAMIERDSYEAWLAYHAKVCLVFFATHWSSPIPFLMMKVTRPEVFLMKTMWFMGITTMTN